MKRTAPEAELPSLQAVGKHAAPARSAIREEIEAIADLVPLCRGRPAQLVGEYAATSCPDGQLIASAFFNSRLFPHYPTVDWKEARITDRVGQLKNRPPANDGVLTFSPGKNQLFNSDYSIDITDSADNTIGEFWAILGLAKQPIGNLGDPRILQCLQTAQQMMRTSPDQQADVSTQVVDGPCCYTLKDDLNSCVMTVTDRFSGQVVSQWRLLDPIYKNVQLVRVVDSRMFILERSVVWVYE